MDFEDFDGDFDDSAFLQIADTLETQARAPPPPKPKYNYQPVAGPSKPKPYSAAGHAPTTTKTVAQRLIAPLPAVREVARTVVTKHWSVERGHHLD